MGRGGGVITEKGRPRRRESWGMENPPFSISKYRGGQNERRQIDRKYVF